MKYLATLTPLVWIVASLSAGCGSEESLPAVEPPLIDPVSAVPCAPQLGPVSIGGVQLEFLELNCGTALRAGEGRATLPDGGRFFRSDVVVSPAPGGGSLPELVVVCSNSAAPEITPAPLRSSLVYTPGSKVGDKAVTRSILVGVPNPCESASLVAIGGGERVTVGRLFE